MKLDNSHRDYPRLFAAMNEVMRVLAAGGNEQEALSRSCESAALGFGAEKALLLLVEERDPLRLRRLWSKGLSDEQLLACEQGRSIKGVSASVIRGAIAGRRVILVEHPLATRSTGTPALIGLNYSVLCAPVLETARGLPLAVLYFQNNGIEPGQPYTDGDAVWLEGYCSALGHTFGLHLQEQKREQELRALLDGRERPENAPELVGDSAHTQALRRTLHEVFIPATEAEDPEPVLILGERGTGKDLVARYLHAYSARGERPFVAVNCAEISDELAASRFFGHRRGSFTGAASDEPGLFRAAHRGVLFLDEVSELSPRAQATLLRVLENRTVAPVGETREVRVDVQVLLATNREPREEVAAGRLRADLFDRFGVQTIHLAPLRERPWDIPALLAHFVAHHERRLRRKTLGPTQDVRRRLLAYAWPGNVRELARVSSLLVTHAKPGARLDEQLLARASPDLVNAPPNPKAAPVLWEDVPMRQALREIERELILARLERHAWNVRAARESLGLPKTTFHRYMTAFAITPPKGTAED